MLDLDQANYEQVDLEQNIRKQTIVLQSNANSKEVTGQPQYDQVDPT